MTDLTPASAGFDGAKGFRVPIRDCPDYRVRLKRGKTRPADYPDHDFKEQLVWYTPENDPARLLWCNENDEWFELSFTPIQQP